MVVASPETKLPHARALHFKCLGSIAKICDQVEQDHRTVKKRVWLAKGYHSFHSAWRTIRDVEAVHLIRKGRVKSVSQHDSLAQARFISTFRTSTRRNFARIDQARNRS